MVPTELAEKWFLARAEYNQAYQELYVTDYEAFQEAKEQFFAFRATLVAGHKCVYCGCPAQTFDHILAQAKGGPHTADNLNFTCNSCNSSKSTKSIVDFFEHCQKKYRAAMRKEEALEIWLHRIHNISGLLLGQLNAENNNQC